LADQRPASPCCLAERPPALAGATSTQRLRETSLLWSVEPLASLLREPLKVLSGVLMMINNNGKHALGIGPETAKFSLYRLTNDH